MGAARPFEAAVFVRPGARRARETRAGRTVHDVADAIAQAAVHGGLFWAWRAEEEPIE